VGFGEDEEEGDGDEEEEEEEVSFLWRELEFRVALDSAVSMKTRIKTGTAFGLGFCLSLSSLSFACTT